MIQYLHACRKRLLALALGLGARGKSGQQRIRQWLTATRGDPRESAAETRLPTLVGKGEKSGVRAHSWLWRQSQEVNPAGCKENYMNMAIRQ